MESSEDNIRCMVCGEPASVFISEMESSGGSSKQLAYCIKHAKEHAIIGTDVPDMLNQRDDYEKQFQEVLEIVRSTGSLPIDIMTLPSGARNPFFGRHDAADLTAQDLQGFIDEIRDEKGNE